ncbi:hypothetical protein QQS21_001120 [Conoideocrella luteorostrata]|uniref:Mus7/MMS22 family-domain-containing protein n=1 Tax=Conoideocrella luteorostrata TaxID=1105319 RepID=A0AAJ0G232_9HYPO|nr:hypothetical protein QQS21_001120 [Conoideocrella luteorostrata]
MANWKELGEIPDSEDEESFYSLQPDSQPVETDTTLPLAADSVRDIWEFPESQNDNDALNSLVPDTAFPFEERTFNSASSSPLSSVPSEDSLSPVDDFALTQRKDENAVSSQRDYHPIIRPQSQSPPAVTFPRDYTLLPEPIAAEKHISINQRPALDGTDHDDEARRIAVRCERSLRPRKPIQEHPYRLESAQHSSTWKQHGLKPFRIALEVERKTKSDLLLLLQDKDFEEDRPESSQLPRSTEPLPDNSNFSGGLDASVGLSSTPLWQSPTSGRVGVSSPPCSSGETDNTSVMDQDLPALDELLRKPPRLTPAKASKRIATPPKSSNRKRRRRNIIDSDPVEQDRPRSVSPGNSPGAPLLSTLRAPNSLHTSHKSLGAPLLGQGRHSPRVSESPTREFISDITTISSDNHSNNEQTLDDDVQTLSSPENVSGSNEEAVTAMSRRIRGVLPASWLRLDQQAGREKAQKTVRNNNRSHRSPARDARRGVAQVRPATLGSKVTPTLYDDSEDESSGNTLVIDTDRIESPGRLSLNATGDQKLYEAVIIEDEEEHGEVDEDEESVVEDDRIDFMQVSRKLKKRQLRLTGSTKDGIQRATRCRMDRGPVPHRAKLKQTKVTDQVGGRETSNRSRSPEIQSRNPILIKRKYGGNQMGAMSTQARLGRPKIGILDTIPPDAPRFLKIAARVARNRVNQGRSSPHRKIIQFATRKDQLDAASVLNQWRSGLIQQRDWVNVATNSFNKDRDRPVLREVPGNQRGNLAPLAQVKTYAPRKFVKHVSDGGLVQYLSRNHQPDRSPTTRTRNISTRPAQLETEQSYHLTKFEFHSKKRFFDHLYQNGHSAVTRSGKPSLPDCFSSAKAKSPCVAIAKDLTRPGNNQSGSRYHKKTLPRKLDISAPQYSRAKDPIFDRYSVEPGPDNTNSTEGKLRGLGPFGTQYTHHFETFPLHPSVFFHESTLIGGGQLHSSVTLTLPQDWTEPRRSVSLSLNSHVFTWGQWNAQVSSELGVVLDFITEQLEAQMMRRREEISHRLTAVQATHFVLGYVTDSISFVERSHKISFVSRVQECLKALNTRIASVIRCTVWKESHDVDDSLRVYDRLLLMAFIILRICRADSDLMIETFAFEELLQCIASAAISALVKYGVGNLQTFYAKVSGGNLRDRGIRDDGQMIHSWVMNMRILEMAQISRGSFWDVAQQHIAPKQAMTSVNAQDHERVWRDMFTLLPLTEFSNLGLITDGLRQNASNDGWGIPHGLLRQVFQLYRANPRQTASFNNYCRSLVGRCHYLVQEWGWHKCVSVVRLIFDFFSVQELAHLRNEEVYKSPRFLENLANRPVLQIETDDPCFHVFLKLVAIAIQKSRDDGSLKEIGNLVARTVPNHNRQHSKDEKIYARDLAALRNHHDLLCTLFWAAPSEYRPSPSLIQNLVVPATSHKEACLINLRAWTQLARFVIASGEAMASWKPFHTWRNSFSEQVLQQFNSVASDVALQLATLDKEVSRSVSREMVDTTIAINKAAFMDVLHASVVASLDAVKHARDLASATFALNRSQLRIIFNKFLVAPPDLKWELLRDSLTTLGQFLTKIDECKTKEESQQSESEIPNSAVAEDAILVLDQELSQSFFNMARCVLSSGSDDETSLTGHAEHASCVEQIVILAARISTRFINGGLMQLSSTFNRGKYQLFNKPPHQLDLGQRKYLVLFVLTLLQYDVDNFDDAGFSLSEFWTSSLTKPRLSLRYEIQLGHQLRRHGKTFIPDELSDLSIHPDYNINRSLFEHSISSMRESLRDAGPTHKILTAEYSSTLKVAMEQMKGDLRITSQMPTEHNNYVVFIQKIVSLIKTYASDICAVDDYFYQISREYSPSTEDPQLQLAGLMSYGLKLQDRDTRSSRALFHLLFNNAKFSIVNGRLNDQVDMLRKGMSNKALNTFIMYKMLPAVVNATFAEPEAFPLLDMYMEVLHYHFAGKVVSHELALSELERISILLHTIWNGMNKIRTRTEPLKANQLHLLRQAIALQNLLWPSIYVLSVSQPASQDWAALWALLSDLWSVLCIAEDYLRGFVATDIGPAEIHGRGFFTGLEGLPAKEYDFGSDVTIFTENIVQDIRKDWKFTEGTITIGTQGRGKVRASRNALPLSSLFNSCISQSKNLLSRPQAIRGLAVADMSALFGLPNEELLAPLLTSFPGREHQIRSLATLIHPDAAPCRNLVIHGTEATGKSSITQELLAQLSRHIMNEPQGGGLKHIVVNAAQCITTRHLFERIVGSVADALQVEGDSGDSSFNSSATLPRQRQRRCETLAHLCVAMSAMLMEPTRDPRWRFILVLDAIDMQRDASPTLIPGLTRLSEIIPCLTCIFIVTSPPAGFLRTPASAHLHFSPYTKPEFVRILALSPPPPIFGLAQQETTDLWMRFCAAVHDAFVRPASRTLPSFRYSCRALWQRFTAPITRGTYSHKEFSKLLVAARAHFQDELLLNPSIISIRLESSSVPAITDGAMLSKAMTSTTLAASDLTVLLPIAARVLLLSAYLASHNGPKHDFILFSTYHHGRKRRRGGGFVGNRGVSRSKHRKIARKLLGGHAFVLERMMAIFEAVRDEWVPEGSIIATAGLDGDVGMAIATLASLRLLVRVGAGDLMDRAGKWRINVGWEAIRSIGRSIGVEVEEWLIE